MSGLEDAHAEIRKFTPEEGFNVVGVDAFERPGEALYLVGHYATRHEAQAAARAHEASSGDRAHVYAPPRSPGPRRRRSTGLPR
jgi:hypothetical protein